VRILWAFLQYKL